MYERRAHDRVGGSLAPRCDELRFDAGATNICILSVRGFDDRDNTLEINRQLCQDEKIDVKNCIDAQLNAKRGHRYV